MGQSSYGYSVQSYSYRYRTVQYGSSSLTHVVFKSRNATAVKSSNYSALQIAKSLRHKCFCIEMCFACSLLFRQGFAVCHKIWPYRRDSLKNVNIKKYHRLVRFFADKYAVTEPISMRKTKNLLIISKVFPNLYFTLVVVTDEFDFSVSR